MAIQTELKNTVLSNRKFKKQSKTVALCSLCKLKTQTLETTLPILEGYTSSKTEQLPTEVGIGNTNEKINMARGGLQLTG